MTKARKATKQKIIKAKPTTKKTRQRKVAKKKIVTNPRRKK